MQPCAAFLPVKVTEASHPSGIIGMGGFHSFVAFSGLLLLNDMLHFSSTLRCQYSFHVSTASLTGQPSSASKVACPPLTAAACR
jgi:hypothetical protein